jgi:hypothetical protein
MERPGPEYKGPWHRAVGFIRNVCLYTLTTGSPHTPPRQEPLPYHLGLYPLDETRSVGRLTP